MKRICFMPFICLVFLFFINACESNTNSVFDHNASVDGYVKFNDAATDTISALTRISSNFLILEEIYTDVNGYYKFNDLASGDYYLSFKCNGYALTGYSITLVANQNSRADTILMKRILPMNMMTQLIDGNIDENWIPVYTQDHVSNWGPNDFSELYLSYDEEYLYVAVTGDFEENPRNTVTIMIDTDGNYLTGISDFSNVIGDEIGNRIRKSIHVAEDFGADISFNAGRNFPSEVVELENIWEVDQHKLEHISVITQTVMEFKIERSLIFDGNELPDYISLVAYIGALELNQYANDVIPQYGDFQGIFQEIFTIGF